MVEATASRAARALDAWYRSEGRDLPWRESRDPYEIWISEVMLQQTRVETVRGHYGRFLARFPSLEALAAASLEDVREAWSGLGYYRRAEALWRASRQVLEEGGSLPKTPEALRNLPGIGAYTSAAIAAIAFSYPSAAIDGNVLRVAARVLGLDLPVDHRDLARAATLWAQAIVEAGDPGVLVQALMELGATRCTPTRVGCEGCPLGEDCLSRALPDPRIRPLPKKRAPPKRWAGLCVIAELEDGRIALHRRPEGGLLGGLWFPPSRVGSTDAPEIQRAEAEPHRVALELLSPMGLTPSGPAELSPLPERARWRFTHILLEPRVLRVKVQGEPADAYTPERWAKRGIPGATRALLRATGIAISAGASA